MEVPDIILKTLVLDFYVNETVFADGKVTYTLTSTLSLPTASVFDFSVISKDDMAASLKRFSSSGQEISPSCFNKILKMEYQVLADILAKDIMIKAGNFDRITNKNIIVMLVSLRECRSTGPLLISKLYLKWFKTRVLDLLCKSAKMKDAGFVFTGESDGTSVTLIDVVNVVALSSQRHQYLSSWP